MHKISVVIPAFNEEKRIKTTLEGIINYFKKTKYIYEILVVDDGSRDKTSQIVQSFNNKNIIILKNKYNKGKGYSVNKGILNAKYPLILFTDSDLAIPIKELDNFLKYTQSYNILIASRNLKESHIQVKQPVHRRLLGKSFPLFVNLIVGLKYKDTQCGFKLLKSGVGKKIAKLQKINGFAFDVELLFIAEHLGYKAKEIPVTCINREGGSVNPTIDSIKMLRDLLKIRYFGIIKKYN
jgi:dolichyl-phosphate beta-glucosyltransferase